MFGNCKLSNIDQHGRKGSLQSRGADGMLGHVVIKTMDSGLNPETSTSWLVTEVSLSPLISSSEAWGKVKTGFLWSLGMLALIKAMSLGKPQGPALWVGRIFLRGPALEPSRVCPDPSTLFRSWPLCLVFFLHFLTPFQAQDPTASSSASTRPHHPHLCLIPNSTQ